MTILENTRHERFAQEVAKGKSHGEAYQIAGYSCRSYANRDSAAFRLSRHVQVRRRISELQKHAVENTDVTIVGLIREAAEIQLAAMRKGNHAAAVAALTAKAKLSGYWIERSESENANIHYTISDTLPSDEQWQRERCGMTIEAKPAASNVVGVSKTAE